jgi:NarL family two-component system response regulator LiaR
MIRLIIVDDHTVVRQGMRFLFDQEPDIEVVGECATGAAVAPAVAALRPDVVLLDLFLPDIDGIAVLQLIRAGRPGTAVVMLTAAPDDAHLVAALRTGATSYLQKTAEAAEVLATVRAAARGESTLPTGVATRLLGAIREEAVREAGGRIRPLDRLTPRERDVLVALAEGRSNREIGRTLRISEETVKTHLSSVLAKLGVADRTQAAIYALRHGVVGTPPVG